MRNDTIHDRDDRDVRYKHFVILLHDFKGIYAILSRIWKCRKSRVFGANFLGKKFGWCYIFRFLQLWWMRIAVFLSLWRTLCCQDHLVSF